MGLRGADLSPEYKKEDVPGKTKKAPRPDDQKDDPKDKRFHNI